MSPIESARKARKLARAQAHALEGTFSDTLGAAYMRLLCAYREHQGVRLSAAEVQALFELDNAVYVAAENIEAEFVGGAEDAAGER